MKDFIKKHDLITKTFALMSAFVLWMYVTGYENPERIIEYHGIPVELRGEKLLLNAYNLSIISGNDNAIKVKIRGKSDQMARLTGSQIRASADLSNIKAPGKFTVPYEVVLPMDTVSIVSKMPNYIDIEVDKIISKFIPVYVVVTGNPSTGYIYEDPVLSEKSIGIEGPEAEVAQIDHALVTVSADKLTKDLNVSSEFELINKNQEVVKSANITKSQATVGVLLTIKQVKEVDLQIKLIEGNETTSDMVTVKIDPVKVKIIGKEGELAKINSITLGTINLADVGGRKQYEFPISVPASVSLHNKSIQKATVNLVIDEKQSMNYSVTKFEIIDKALPEQKKQVELTQPSVVISLKVRKSVAGSIDWQKTDVITGVIEIDSSVIDVGEVLTDVRFVTGESVDIIGQYKVSLMVGEQ